MSQFWLLPNIVIYAIFGAVGGAGGAVIGALIGKFYKNKRVIQIFTLICIAASVQVANIVVPKYQKAAAVDQVMSSLRAQRLFAVIFKSHPSSESEMRALMASVINNSASGDVFNKSAQASSEFVAKYVTLDTPMASDDTIYAVLANNSNTLKSLQNDPKNCVNYYLGLPYLKEGQMSADTLKKESDLKADLIESSVKSPSPPPTNVNITEVSSALEDAYKLKGYDFQHLNEIDKVGQLPPETGCKIATEFSDVLASIPNKKSAYIFKALISLGK